MEVHHPANRHPGMKKFKEYLKEFLMIFLAVIMGYLAENFRESINDRHHVQELAGQLKQDLKNDTVNIQRLIEIEKLQIRRADSLFALLVQPMGQIDFQKLQGLLVACDNIQIFYPATGASSTIKTELHLKEFVRKQIASHIDNYEKEITVLEKFENRNIDYIGKILETFMSLHFTPGNAAAAVNGEPFINNEMRNITPENVKQLSVDINLIKAYNLQLVNRYTRIKTAGVSFIQHINNTYDLDDD